MSAEPATFEDWWPRHFRDHSGMSQGVLARAAWDQATKSAEAKLRVERPILVPFHELPPEMEELLFKLRQFLFQSYTNKKDEK